jgi:hypothetical protein
LPGEDALGKFVNPTVAKAAGHPFGD